MIDYDKLDDDPVVAEVRRAREEIAAGLGYDLRAICEEMQRRQATSGRRYASIPPHPAEPAAAEPAKKVG